MTSASASSISFDRGRTERVEALAVPVSRLPVFWIALPIFSPGFLVGSCSRILLRFLALYPVPAGRSTARLIYVNSIS